MLLMTLRELPKKGSLQEWLLTLFLLKKEEIEYARELAFAQILVEKEKGIESWKIYQEIARPYIKTAQEEQKQAFIKKLREEAARGPMLVKPLWQKEVRSRLRTQEEVTDQVEKMYRRPPQEIHKIMAGLNPIIPPVR